MSKKQTAIQELQEKVIKIIDDNSKQNSQFHKGFRHGMIMVKDAIEHILLEKEKQNIIDAWNNGESNWLHEQNNEHFENGEQYYNNTFNQ